MSDEFTADRESSVGFEGGLGPDEAEPERGGPAACRPPHPQVARNQPKILSPGPASDLSAGFRRVASTSAGHPTDSPGKNKVDAPDLGAFKSSIQSSRLLIEQLQADALVAGASQAVRARGGIGATRGGDGAGIPSRRLPAPDQIEAGVNSELGAPVNTVGGSLASCSSFPVFRPPVFASAPLTMSTPPADTLTPASTAPSPPLTLPAPTRTRTPTLPPGYRFTSNPDHITARLPDIYAALTHPDIYWGLDRTPDTLATQIAHSWRTVLVLKGGEGSEGELAAFCRVVGDGWDFGYLADVLTVRRAWRGD